MQIERGSLLLGFVLGLAVAAILMAGSVVLASRDGRVSALAQSTVGPGLQPAATSTTTTMRPSPTPPSSPTAARTPLPPTPTATPTATPQPPALRYEAVEVPARKFTVVEVPAELGQTLELTVTVDSDIDLTLFAPDGSIAQEPLRVRGSQTLRRFSEVSGTWGIKLDNSFSWITSKQVLLQYRLLPGR